MKFFEISALIVAAVSSLEAIDSECNTHKNESDTKVAYYGWPLSLSCDDYLDFYETGSGSTVQCIISDHKSKKVLYNATQYINEDDYYYGNNVFYFTTIVTENSTMHFDVTLNVNGSCTTNMITISATHLPEVACDLNFRNHSLRARPRQGKSTFTLYCQDPDGRRCSPESHTYWSHNCDRNLPDDTYMDGEGNLVLKDVSYEHHLGVFTCSCEYNGMTRFIATYDPCISFAETQGLTVKCNNQTSLQIGGNANVKCTVDAGVGDDDVQSYSAKVNKLETSEDENKSMNETKCSITESNAPKARLSCEIKNGESKGDKSKGSSCLRRKPTQQEIDSKVTRFQIFFTIRDLKSSDFGSYHVQVRYLYSLTTTAVFSLEEDKKPNIKILLYLILPLVAVLILSLLLWIFRVELKWLWWTNCKSEERGTKQYTGLKQI